MSALGFTSKPSRWTLSWFLRDPSGKIRIAWKLIGFCAIIPFFGVGQDWVLKRLNHGVYPTLPFKVGDIVVALLPTWLLLRLERRPLVSLGLRMDLRWLRDLGLGFLLACALMIFASVGVAFTQGGWVRTPLGPNVLAQGLSICIGTAVFEELLFRGYPFQRMAEAWGAKTAQGLMAFLFVVPHLLAGLHRSVPVPSLVGASLNIGCGALFLGFAFLRTRSLALPIGIHVGWNWMQGTVLGLGVSGGTPPSFLAPAQPCPLVSWLTGGAYGPEAGLPGTLAVLIGIVAIVFLCSSSDAQTPLADGSASSESCTGGL